MSDTYKNFRNVDMNGAMRRSHENSNQARHNLGQAPDRLSPQTKRKLLIGGSLSVAAFLGGMHMIDEAEQGRADKIEQAAIANAQPAYGVLTLHEGVRVRDEPLIDNAGQDDPKDNIAFVVGKNGKGELVVQSPVYTRTDQGDYFGFTMSDDQKNPDVFWVSADVLDQRDENGNAFAGFESMDMQAAERAGDEHSYSLAYSPESGFSITSPDVMGGPIAQAVASQS